MMLSNITDIQYLKGVGEKRARLLNKLGIDSVGALLYFFPRDYKDLSVSHLIYDTALDETVCIKAEIVTPIKENYIRKNMTLYKFTAADSSGTIGITLFNNKYLAQKLHTGSTYIFYGKMSGGVFMREMSAPEIYEAGNNSILPVYPLTAGITLNYLRTLIDRALKNTEIKEFLPEAVREKYNLCDIKYALENIHFPRSQQSLDRAKKRLIFEELFLLQCGMMYFSVQRRGRTATVLKQNYTHEFISHLPFTPTNAQMRVIGECLADMEKPIPMNRLLQGDVGSGKTMVAAALCYNAVKNNYQAVLMAPTVILAEQHFETFKKFLNDTGVRCELLTSALTPAKKRALLEKVQNAEVDVLIGTHAVLTDKVQFNNLGLVITDEQHRFGVTQRETLNKKGESPHTLVMSATPIPRTLALVIYGDLDVSIIDEYPRGRQKIDCFSVARDLRRRVYTYVKKHLDEGRQGYIVCPLVEENDTDRTSAEKFYKQLSTGFFKDYKLGLLHGKMSSADKERVMRSFSNGEIDLLVATTVIEVGVDVPNAAIMVIEDADCFGLSQLHQLRGRVGRGEYKSTCILVSGAGDKSTSERLQVLCRTGDGFKIAEEDLKLRGPGDFMGSRQHGLPNLRIADINTDYELLCVTQAAAKAVISEDKHLLSDENRQLKSEIIRLFKNV